MNCKITNHSYWNNYFQQKATRHAYKKLRFYFIIFMFNMNSFQSQMQTFTVDFSLYKISTIGHPGTHTQFSKIQPHTHSDIKRKKNLLYTKCNWQSNQLVTAVPCQSNLIEANSLVQSACEYKNHSLLTQIQRFSEEFMHFWCTDIKALLCTSSTSFSFQNVLHLCVVYIPGGKKKELLHSYLLLCLMNSQQILTNIWRRDNSAF